MPAALLKRLSRVTSSGRFIPEIDGLRFFAIALVVLFHLAGYLRDKSPLYAGQAPLSDPLYRLCDLGNIGVQLFFTLSGFILALPFAEHYLLGRPGVPLGPYFIRRLTRLEPPYFINLLLLFLARLALGGAPATTLFPHLLASACYVHNLAYDTWSRINFVAWSLEIEVQFYLLAPFLARVFALRRPGVRRALLITASLAAAVLQHHRYGAHFPHGLSLVDQLQFFLTGFVLADLYLTRWGKASGDSGEPGPGGGTGGADLARTGAWGWDVVAAAAWLGMAAVLEQAPAAGRFVTPVLIFLIYAGAFRGVLWRQIVRNRWLTAIGGMCYTLYLYHPYLILMGIAFTNALPATSSFTVDLLIRAGLILPPLLTVSAVLFVWLERPFMRRDWPATLLAGLLRWTAHLRVRPR